MSNRWPVMAWTPSGGVEVLAPSLASPLLYAWPMPDWQRRVVVLDDGPTWVLSDGVETGV